MRRARAAHVSVKFWFRGTKLIGRRLHSGIVKHRFTFLAASFFSIVGTLFLLIGASIWTSAIGKAQTINNVTLVSRTSLSENRNT